MAKISTLIFICFLLFFSNVKAQSDSVIIHKSLIDIKIKKAFKTPVLLLGAGMLAFADIDFIGRADIYEERNERAPAFKTHIDDYLQYAPIAGVLVLNTLGVKGEHSFSKQMWLLAKSELIMAAIVCPLKQLTEVPRPDGTSHNSFPSGHTAQAFVAATFIHKEYGKQNLIYSILGYGSATAVGAFRVLNNRHWTTDVFFGAGIGILSTNLAYLLDDHRKIKKLKILAVPTYQNGNFGIGAIIPLK
jgi:membrane-associated phospholipid phosphatase